MTWTYLLVPAAVIAGTLLWFWQLSRADDLLERWAARNGLEILSAERRVARRGPFFFTTGDGQEVFRVTVRTRSGAVRSGYVRCGGWLFGMFSSRVTAQWD